MEKKKIILSILIFLLSVSFFYSYIRDYIVWTPDNDNIYSSNQYSELTIKENDFIDSLEYLYFYKVDIKKPLIGLHGPFGSNVYNLSFSSVDLSDSINLEPLYLDLGRFMYKNVIEDSFIYDMSYIYIENEICSKTSKKCKLKVCRLFKDSLEKWCGFRVVKVHEDKFKRIVLR